MSEEERESLISVLKTKRDRLYDEIVTQRDEEIYNTLTNLILYLKSIGRGGRGDWKPIHITIGQLRNLGIVIARALNKNQIKILEELANDGYYITVTNFLQTLSEKEKIPLSTLRWNVKVLEDLGLITCGNSKNKGIPVKLTDTGRLIWKIIRDRSSAGEHSAEARVVWSSTLHGLTKDSE